MVPTDPTNPNAPYTARFPRLWAGHAPGPDSDLASLAARVMLLGALIADQLDASIEERLILLFAEHTGALRPVDVAAMLGISQSRASRAVAALRTEGLLRHDCAALTTAGRHRLTELLARLRLATRAVTDDLVEPRRQEAAATALRAVAPGATLSRFRRQRARAVRRAVALAR